jgi:hypothetical protein
MIQLSNIVSTMNALISSTHSTIVLPKKMLRRFASTWSHVKAGNIIIDLIA